MISGFLSSQTVERTFYEQLTREDGTLAHLYDMWLYPDTHVTHVIHRRCTWNPSLISLGNNISVMIIGTGECLQPPPELLAPFIWTRTTKGDCMWGTSAERTGKHEGGSLISSGSVLWRVPGRFSRIWNFQQDHTSKRATEKRFWFAPRHMFDQHTVYKPKNPTRSKTVSKTSVSDVVRHYRKILSTVLLSSGAFTK